MRTLGFLKLIGPRVTIKAGCSFHFHHMYVLPVGFKYCNRYHVDLIRWPWWCPLIWDSRSCTQCCDPSSTQHLLSENFHFPCLIVRAVLPWQLSNLSIVYVDKNSSCSLGCMITSNTWCFSDYWMSCSPKMLIAHRKGMKRAWDTSAAEVPPVSLSSHQTGSKLYLVSGKL